MIIVNKTDRNDKNMFKTKNIQKRGYLFILDSIISLLVLTIGISLILSFRAAEPVTQQAEIYSSDIVQFLTKIKIKDLNNEYMCINGEFVANGNITNTENNLLDQLSEFYFRYSNQSCSFCLNLTNVSINSLTKSLLLDQYNFEIAVDDPKLQKRTVLYINKNKPKKENAQLVLPIRRMTSGVYNNTLYGPYIMEVILWQ